MLDLLRRVMMAVTTPGSLRRDGTNQDLLQPKEEFLLVDVASQKALQVADELIKDGLIAVIDATKWAERCKECYSEYSLARVLEEALPLFITRKHAFHQLLKQVGAASLALAITPVRRRPSATPRVPARWNRWKRPSRISSGRR